MVNICYYISDYGYGHASRSIAVVRRMLHSFDAAKLYIKTDYPFDFIRQSLPQKNAKAIRIKNDVGVIFRKNSVSVDRDETEKMLDEWLFSWDEYIRREKEFCKKNHIDLILSDVPPQPFIVAEELGLPSIVISNFTWYYIFFGLFGKTKSTMMLKRAYRRAHVSLILPLNEEMDYIKNRKEVGLVAREVTVDKSDLRNRCGVSKDAFLIFLSVGRSFDQFFLNSLKEVDYPNVKFLVSSHVELPFGKTIKIPSDETETQNYIAACDLIISKAGYSTIAEAINARVPVFLFERDGFKEDELIGNGIKKIGVGNVISAESFLNGDWIVELENLPQYKARFDALEDRFRGDGTKEVVGCIADFLGGQL